MIRPPWLAGAPLLALAWGIGWQISASASDTPSRFTVRATRVEENAAPSRFDAHAALRESPLDAPAPNPRLHLKARLGGDALDTTCGTADGLFANGFE